VKRKIGVVMISLVLLAAIPISSSDQSDKQIPLASGIDVDLNFGWNLITIPLNTSITTASQWAATINADIQPQNNVSEIVRLTRGLWVSWIAEIPTLNDFTLLDAEACFVNINGSTNTEPTWHCAGERYNSSIPLNLCKGWNQIGIPYSYSIYDADDLLSQNDNFTMLANWSTSGWELRDGAAGKNFDLVGRYDNTANPNGFFVYSGKATSWKPPSEPPEWSEDLRLTNSGIFPAMYPDIAVNENVIHVVWENSSGNDEIFYRRSADLGYTWKNEIQISHSGGSELATCPSIAVNGSNVYITWEDSRNSGKPEIYFKKSSDYGQTWSEDKLLSQKDSQWSCKPSIAAWEDNVYVVWYNDTDPSVDTSYEVTYCNSSDCGETWWPEQQLTPSNSKSSLPAGIAVNDTNIHIIFSDYYGGRFETRYLRSIDGGVSWDPLKNISKVNDGWNSDAYGIAINNSHLHVVWRNEQDEGILEVYYKKSDDNGDTWGEEKRLSPKDNEVSEQPAISIDGDYVHVIYRDERDHCGTYSSSDEIYYNSSTDGGNTWQISSDRLTVAENMSRIPSITTRDGYVHIVWMDARNGGTATDYEIYYKRSPGF